MYLIDDAGKIINILKSNNIECEIIGGVARIGYSEHDIDIYVMSEIDRDELIELLIETFLPEKIIDTDWGGIYLKNTLFGDIDVFLRIDNLDYV